MSHAHLNFNRNKRSVVIDLKTAAASSMLSLLDGCDVFVSNVRAPALRRLGLDTESLRAAHPSLIHCSCYGYSEKGPYAGRAAVDDTIQAASGSRLAAGLCRRAPPEYVKRSWPTRWWALCRQRDQRRPLRAREDGAGQSIEVPMFESMVAFLSRALAGLTFVPDEGPAGYTRLLNAFRRPFRTKDGYIGVVPYTDGQWQRFFALAGKPQMARTRATARSPRAARRFAELYEYVEKTLATRGQRRVACAVGEGRHPLRPRQLDRRASSKTRTSRRPASGASWTIPPRAALRQPGLPIHFSRTPASIRRHAPGLGEHNQELLAQPNKDVHETALEIARRRRGDCRDSGRDCAGLSAKPIGFVVGFPAGSSIDVVSRIVLEDVRARTGATIVIDNKPGALGALGIDAVQRAEPDGYTLMPSSSATHSWAPTWRTR